MSRRPRLRLQNEPAAPRQPGSPLVLQSIGSFYVGGRTVSMSAAETGLYGGGPLVVDQMYVQYMIPKGHPKAPVVMIHGGTLSGKSYETTPDGRMGWYEYFARRGFPSYVVDQVGRTRSGFDQAPFNNVRAELAAPTSQPNLRRVATDIAWVQFRFGPVAGVKFDDTQFPVEAAGEFAKQAVPDLSQSLPPNNPNYSALSELAKDLKKRGPHGTFPGRPVSIRNRTAGPARYNGANRNRAARVQVKRILGRTNR